MVLADCPNQFFILTLTGTLRTDKGDHHRPLGPNAWTFGTAERGSLYRVTSTSTGFLVSLVRTGKTDQPSKAIIYMAPI
jgi:hypothetical protein